MKKIINIFAAMVVLVLPVVVLLTHNAQAATPLIPNFQRSWGNLNQWEIQFPVRETLHARNPQADPDSVKDGWWSDFNFHDSMPVGWDNDPRFFGNTRDFGFAQAERFLAKFEHSGAIKFLPDASGKPLKKRMKIEVIIPANGTYRFQSWAWFSRYNGSSRNLHLAMELAVNGVHVAEPNVQVPLLNTWQELKKDLVLHQGDRVKVTLVADQKNESNEGLLDAYFTLPEGGTGVKL